MRPVLLLLLAVLTFTQPTKAGNKDKKAVHAKSVDTTAITWLSIDDVQVKMNEEPRQVYIDIYTDWCGWCKRMDATTFKNPHVIKYMNEHFYAVKLNAETKDSIRFMGRMYGFDPTYRSNTLAVELLHGQLSYPTAVIFTKENFQNPTPVAGYMDVSNIEMVLKYVAGNMFQTQSFQDYQHGFKSTWAQQ